MSSRDQSPIDGGNSRAVSQPTGGFVKGGAAAPNGKFISKKSYQTATGAMMDSTSSAASSANMK